ncbi:signal peptidase I [Nibricoccus aquaticus]|uniref:Signal peptidase I n=1 Tax=Nibricoccus aquaticus TaxID=2576891 RepID=A0A290QB51_9BACT|nr:signal peptidase I [Nibricoccus aquaticus]ATC62538.1 signal peptidase I [Nibricoccus aquaticus]
MFGLFSSVEKQMRANATNWLELADKIFNYRRDEISAADRADLQQKSEQLRAQLRDKADASKLKLGIEALEPAVRRAGGKFYPRSTIQEYVEFFVVAAIVILGLRAYFVQPFKIPTNSMWPTYYGMTGEVFASEKEEPGVVASAARLVAFGATRRSVDAPVDGDVWVPVSGNRIPSAVVPGRTWFVFPSRVQQITLRVGSELVTVQVPLDFKMDEVIEEAFFSAGAPRTQQVEAGFLPSSRAGQNIPVRWINTGKHVKKGERVLSFDVMTGDQLFVDRMSYHFVRPQVGSGFVFRTDNIRSPYLVDAGGRPVESYYIKRLVGTPGDKLEVRDSALLRNGEPITGSLAFDKNARQEGLYRGYKNQEALLEKKQVEVSTQGYYAMGDNSGNSLDSRYWGEVPYKDIVGRPLFIYYPFTKRWGPAR